MNGPAQTLLDLLAAHRANIADYEKRRAIEFDPTLNRKLELERQAIASIKQKLRQLNVNVDDDPLDDDLSVNAANTGQNKSKAPRGRKASPIIESGNMAEDKSIKAPESNVLWILALLALALVLATIAAKAVADLTTTLAIFVFTLLILGIILPFVGLQSKSLSQRAWFNSYVATLEKIPGLGSLLNDQSRFSEKQQSDKK